MSLNDSGGTASPYYWTEISEFVQSTMSEELLAEGLDDITVPEYMAMYMVAMSEALETILSVEEAMLFDEHVMEQARSYSYLLLEERLVITSEVEALLGESGVA